MRYASASKIVILPNRQRQEFDPDAMQELADSIEAQGLMHPPVMRIQGDDLVLVAGERRLKTILQLHELGIRFKCDGEVVPEDLVPYTMLGELSELEAEEAELDENLKRKDLTWQEHAAATARLHALRQKQHPKLLTVVSDSDPEDPNLNKTITVGSTHTIADTAKELLGRSDGAYQDQIRKEVIVAKYLDNPIVAKAKSADEAFKLLKREEAAKKNRELALEVGKTFNADLHALFNRDCLGFMAEVAAGPEDQKFDVILTDPPYGMGAQDFGNSAGKFTGIEHHYDDSYESWKKLMDGPSGWCNLSYQVCKPQAHAYVFCDIDRFGELKAMMQSAGWYVFRTPLINVKTNSGRVPLPELGPRRQYEILLYAIKGKKPTTHIYPDVITSNADENLSHGAQKPVALYQNLLQRSVKPGDRVADFFAGSGTIFEAAQLFQCYATGTEVSTEYYGMCLARINRLKAAEQPSLLAGLEQL